MRLNALTILAICVTGLGCGHARQLKVELMDEFTEAFEAERATSRPAVLRLESVDGDRAGGTLKYAGGCGAHSFRIVATTFLESYPVQVPLTVLHRSDDTCTRPIREKIRLDLAPLKKAYLRGYMTSKGVMDIGLPNDALYRF
jgi:hypothetical protein